MADVDGVEDFPEEIIVDRKEDMVGQSNIIENTLILIYNQIFRFQAR